VSPEETSFRVSRPTLDPPLERLSKKVEAEHYHSKQLTLFPNSERHPDVIKELTSGIALACFSVTRDPEDEVTTSLGELAERFYHRPPALLGSRERRAVVEELAKLHLVSLPRIKKVPKNNAKGGVSLYYELRLTIPIPTLTFRMLANSKAIVLSHEKDLAEQVDRIVERSLEGRSGDGWAKTEVSFRWNPDILSDLRADLFQIASPSKLETAESGAGDMIFKKDGRWHRGRDGKVIHDSGGYVTISHKATEIESRLRSKRDSTAITLMRILSTRSFPSPELSVEALFQKLRLDPERAKRSHDAIRRAIKNLKAEGVLAGDSPEEPSVPANAERRKGEFYVFKVNRGLWVKEGKKAPEGKPHPYPPETTADQLLPILKDAPKGSELREAREALDLSLRSAGLRLGVPFSDLSLIERDKKPLPMRAVEEAWRMVKEGKAVRLSDQPSANVTAPDPEGVAT